MKELLSNVGSGGGAPAVGAPAAGGGGGAPAAEAPAEEKKEEEKEESDDDMVRGYSVCSCLSSTNIYLYRGLVSSTDLQAVVFICTVFSLHFPSRCISLCITRK